MCSSGESPAPHCSVAALLSEKIPESTAQPEHWARGATISVAIHVLVILGVVLGGFCSIAAEEPPLTVMGEISLTGWGSPGGSGGNGCAGEGSPAPVAELAPQPAPEPAAEVAEAEEQPKPAPLVEEPKQPEIEPKPILDPKAAKKEKKAPPKKAKKRHKTVRKRAKKARAKSAATQAVACRGPITAPNAPANGLGTGMGTGRGDGAGTGSGLGLGHGDGPPGIGGGPGGSGHGFQFGQGDGPRFRHRALPQYPPEAREVNKEGVVTLRLTIDKSGHLCDVKVMRNSGQEFVEAALRAIRSSTFYPAKHKGRAISSRALLTIRFRIG